MSDLSYIVRVCVTTIAGLSFMIVGVFLYGLFRSEVDNNKVFEILGPMAHEIVGGLLILVGGITTYYFTRPKDITGEGKVQ